MGCLCSKQNKLDLALYENSRKSRLDQVINNKKKIKTILKKKNSNKLPKTTNKKFTERKSDDFIDNIKKKKIKIHHQQGVDSCSKEDSLNLSESENENSQIFSNDTNDKELNNECLLKESIKLSDFNILGTIGSGSFGKVLKAKLKNTFISKLKLKNDDDSNIFSSIADNTFALKILKKTVIKNKKLVNTTKSERIALSKIQHVFKIDLFFSFQTNSHLYLVTELVSGGDLQKLMNKIGKMPEEIAKFYLAEIALVIDFLHKNKIIYRDLKPENVLIASDGHIKICDFGLCKIMFDEDTTGSVCGTKAYMAPEIEKEDDYSYSVDWFSYGVIAFFLITGYHPFDEKSDKKEDHKIKVKNKLPYFNQRLFTKEATDFISKLLELNPSNRLCGSDIFNHIFFKGLDWGKVQNKQMLPPFNSNKNTDSNLNFDACESSFDKTLKMSISNANLKNEEKYKEGTYEGFTFIKDNLLN